MKRRIRIYTDCSVNKKVQVYAFFVLHCLLYLFYDLNSITKLICYHPSLNSIKTTWYCLAVTKTFCRVNDMIRETRELWYIILNISERQSIVEQTLPIPKGSYFPPHVTNFTLFAFFQYFSPEFNAKTRKKSNILFYVKPLTYQLHLFVTLIEAESM